MDLVKRKISPNLNCKINSNWLSRNAAIAPDQLLEPVSFKPIINDLQEEDDSSFTKYISVARGVDTDDEKYM